ncbi:MAG TPA: lysophospholipid acyltransferase family protein [Anaerolineales bacterium]|nr:lysophospholipid acyltransferase family protein [Anaerolineales bacterium]
MVDLQKVLNGSLSLRLVSALARKLHPQAGYRIASLVAEYLARQRNSNTVRAIRANQWVIHGETLVGADLDGVVRETLLHSARCIFDLYHYVQRPDEAKELIVLEPSFQRLKQRPEFDERGLIVIGLHISNFDLVLQWVCRQGMKPLVLTIPDPQGGRRIEYEMRKKLGLQLLPTSVSALRQALKHLRRGGMVLTGIDRPIPKPQVCPRFFGRPAALPLHHVFLAAKAQVPVVIAVTNFLDDGKYHVCASDPIEMDSYSDPEAGVLRNAEKVLDVAEHLIRRVPQQWSVPLPVWPQVMQFVPK